MDGGIWRNAFGCGLEPQQMSKKSWTEEEDQILRSNTHLSNNRLSKILGVDPSTIDRRFISLGIERLVIPPRKWTDKEDKILRQNTDKTYAELSEILNRNISVIKTRCISLSISRPSDQPHKSWTKEEDDILRNRYGLTNAELSKLLDVNPQTIQRRYKALGINRPRGKVELNRSRSEWKRSKLVDLVPEEWNMMPKTRTDAQLLNSTFYWDGENCYRCDKYTIKYTSVGRCKTCHESYVNEQSKTEKGIERDRSYSKKYYYENRNVCLHRNRAHYAKNKGYFKEKILQWNANNPELRKEIKERRRCMRMNAAVELTISEAEQIRSIYRSMQRKNKQYGKIICHVDHILPLSKGGKHHPSNLQLITARSNNFWKDKVKSCPYPKPEVWKEPDWEV